MFGRGKYRSVEYEYKYNGKELQDELGLNVTAMDYRQYDNALGRFSTLDSMAELKYDTSPYRFGFNNPVVWNDPSGLFETRKEAREYKREHNIRGGVTKNDDGSFSINDKKNNISYFKPEAGIELSNVNSDGVATSPLVVGEAKENNIKEISTAINGVGIGLGVKSELMTYAVAQNFKTATNSLSFSSLRATQQAWRTTNVLGSVGSKLLTATKVLGTVGGVASVGLKGYDIYNKGASNATVRDWADLGVNSAGVVATVFLASNPVGWAVGAACLTYSIGTAVYDLNNKN